MKIVGAPNIDCLEIRQIVGAQRGTDDVFLLSSLGINDLIDPGSGFDIKIAMSICVA